MRSFYLLLRIESALIKEFNNLLSFSLNSSIKAASSVPFYAFKIEDFNGKKRILVSFLRRLCRARIFSYLFEAFFVKPRKDTCSAQPSQPISLVLRRRDTKQGLFVSFKSTKKICFGREKRSMRSFYPFFA